MDNNLIFNIYYKTPDSDNEQLYSFSTSGVQTGANTGLLTLQAVFVDGLARYFLSLTIDGQVYLSQDQGFLTISDLWNWIQQNWISLGSWFYLPTANKIVLYVKASSGSLTIIPFTGVQALFPLLSDGQFYLVQFNGSTSPDETLYTISDVMAYVDTNWSADGTWSTDGIYLIYTPFMPSNNTLTITAAFPGAFSAGFSSGFTI